MVRSNAAWDYAYRYIGGGINRGGTKNWTEWAANATYPIQFAQAASSHDYVAVFTYYTLNATNGRCTTACSEARKDLTNLNTPSVMKLYYNDFARLMQRLGSGTYGGVKGYGKDAIVHVEPDLSGYAESAVLYPAVTGVLAVPQLRPLQPEKLSRPRKRSLRSFLQWNASEFSSPSFTTAGSSPTFSALEDEDSDGGGSKKILIAAAVVLIAAALGYFGWTKLSQTGSSSQSISAPEKPIASAPANITPAQPVTAYAPSTTSPSAAPEQQAVGEHRKHASNFHQPRR